MIRMRNHAFTIIELMTVTAIILILTAITLGVYSSAKREGKKEIFICPLDSDPYANRSLGANRVLPTSYFPAPNGIFDGYFEALKMDSNFTVFVCLLHGESQGMVRDPLNDVSGIVLRLKVDTSVQKNKVGVKCWVGSNGTRLAGRDWWHIFSDSIPPKDVLEEVLGTDDPIEVPCES